VDVNDTEHLENVLESMMMLDPCNTVCPATAAAPLMLYELLPKENETPPPRELAPLAKLVTKAFALQLTKEFPETRCMRIQQETILND
jgi:hypothetical protein